jgi:hypothetical protein
MPIHEPRQSRRHQWSLMLLELKEAGPWSLAYRLALGVIVATLAAGIVFITATLIYQLVTSSGSYRRYYSGKIVDKTTTVLETQQGSLLFHKLVIEEKDGTRFSITVPQEIYERAKVGMLIQRSIQGLQPLPNPDESSTSP